MNLITHWLDACLIVCYYAVFNQEFRYIIANQYVRL
uniref:Uncharacterized protein n=1 Tax=Arundo donax TaxID=35708 RepID=A0A0A9EEV8_ARUDO